MIREGLKHGFSDADWEAGKAEARATMVGRAKLQGMITYSDLIQEIKAIKLDAFDVRLSHMLGEISSEEDAAGRGMLTVLVVHKVGDMEPGPGFYELARSLGRDTTNKMECWVSELHTVHTYWSSK